jgi:prolipoprotein diacylglyceryltransferase
MDLYLLAVCFCLPNILKGVFKKENLKNDAHETLFIYGIVGVFVGARPLFIL